MIIETQHFSNPNNVIRFSDNSRFVQVMNLFYFYCLFIYLCIFNFSAINGFKVKQIKPKMTTGPSFYTSEILNLNLVFTAETHNFPTGVEPFRFSKIQFSFKSRIYIYIKVLYTSIVEHQQVLGEEFEMCKP